MKITILGSGTSHGVPMIGCDCAVCRSEDPRNKRFRPSILVTGSDGANLLVDTPPEMRLAFLQNNVRRLDAIFYTHSHADHIFGLDDVRTFNYRTGAPIPVYAEEDVLEDLRRIYRYIFVPTQNGGGKPQITLNTISPGKLMHLFGMDILPLRVMHGKLPTLAYVFDRKAAYVTDVSAIPEESMHHLHGLDLLLLDAVRREPHPTHFHLDASLEIISQLKPKKAMLVHLSHDYDHAATNAALPLGVQLAYDGETVDLG